jgi:hypothetical protein
MSARRDVMRTGNQSHQIGKIVIPRRWIWLRVVIIGNSPILLFCRQHTLSLPGGTTIVKILDNGAMNIGLDIMIRSFRDDLDSELKKPDIAVGQEMGVAACDPYHSPTSIWENIPLYPTEAP